MRITMEFCLFRTTVPPVPGISLVVRPDSDNRTGNHETRARRRLGDQSHVTAVPLAAAVPPGSTSGPGSAVPGGLASPSR